MKVSIITLANLGEKTNLKTAGILPVIKTFEELGELGQVICQVNKRFYYSGTQEALPRIIRYVINSFGRFFHIPVKNFYNQIFDYFASKKIRSADIVIFHPARFTRSVKKSKSLGAITVGIATVAHPEFDLEIHRSEHNRFGSKFQGINFNKLKETINEIDYIVAYSDFVKETYVANGFPSEKIFVAYSDIKLPEKIEKQDDQDGVFRLLYVSYTNLRKGLQYLLEAWKSADLQNAELVLVGGYSNEMPEEICSYCDQIIESEPNIRWIGSVKDTSDYYKQADAFILPSLSEGNPKVVMEAMGYSLPVITTKNAQSVMVEGESGFVVEPGNVDFLKDKILWIYNNRKEAKDMGCRGREIIENKKSFGKAVQEICHKVSQ